MSLFLLIVWIVLLGLAYRDLSWAGLLWALGASLVMGILGAWVEDATYGRALKRAGLRREGAGHDMIIRRVRK